MRLLSVVTRGEIVGVGLIPESGADGKGGGDEGGKQGSQHQFLPRHCFLGRWQVGLTPYESGLCL